MSFGLKFMNKSKSGEFNRKFWWNDNYVELIMSSVLVLILMIIISNPETIIDTDKANTWVDSFVPWLDFITIPGKLLLPLAIGFGSNHGIYALAKLKKDQGEDKILKEQAHG